MEQQIPLDADARADDPEQDAARRDDTHEVAPDVAYQREAIVNVVFFGLPGAGDRHWVLIDAALPGTAGRIAKGAEERFGVGARPAAILLTHGHFDHVSALQELAERWDAPIYAHPLERPFMDGTRAYPPPDPTVGGGLMSLMSPLFPRGPINVAARLHDLPADGSVPSMPGWRWLHTPGHAPGHVSLWRESDRTLIAGDAFITTAQESVYAAATQRPELHGPPMYFTPDWPSAKTSVERLAALEPEVAVTGHGRAMQGAEMREALHTLARDFDRVAVPDRGRYVLHPVSG
jgi:glyoxylase-like metal-dependent hydrolase (beta-lactamase superfamily II)